MAQAALWVLELEAAQSALGESCWKEQLACLQISCWHSGHLQQPLACPVQAKEVLPLHGQMETQSGKKGVGRLAWTGLVPVLPQTSCSESSVRGLLLEVAYAQVVNPFPLWQKAPLASLVVRSRPLLPLEG